MLSAAHIELPTVPRAGDHAAFQHTSPQRAPLMGTNTVQGVKNPIHVVKGHDPILGDQLVRAARGAIGGAS